MKKCGTIAIMGRPNVGKSTLLNQILGQKISITSKKPQTTRHQIMGIKTDQDLQMIFIDTPGLHSKNQKALNRALNKAAQSVLQDVDLILWVMEPRWTSEEDFILQRTSHLSTPIIAILNKIDKLENKKELLPLIPALQARFSFREIIPISAEKKENIDRLQAAIAKYLPEQAFMFDEEQITDRPLRFMASEIVREKLMRHLGAELPYAVTVQVDSFKEGERLDEIAITIFVEKESQKAIVIGEKGQNLKKIGKSARLDLEKLLEKKVMLHLWVKVKENWSEDEAAVKNLGY